MPIEVTGLCHSYKKGTPFENKVLHDINLYIDDGEFIGIIGPTQAGKTTLAQHFNALIIPQEGKVIVSGCDTTEKNADLVSLRHMVGYVFQNPDYQLFASTVGEDISFGPRNQKLDLNTIRDRVKEAMDQVGLEYDTFYNRDIFALSGGQKRRAAIAGVLACQPKILILDDVTAGLDPRGREEILDVVRRLHEEENITIIFISNSMNEVAELAERIVVIESGRIIADASSREIFRVPAELYKIGLELPEVMAITEKLRSHGFNLPGTVITLEEAVDAIAAALNERREHR